MNLSPIPFPLGFLEVCLLVGLAVAIAIAVTRKRYRRLTGWWIAAGVSFLVAAVLTTADLLSTIILAVLLFGMAVLGSRINRGRKPSQT